MNKSPEQAFFQEDIQMAKKYVKRYSTSQITIKMPIKATMRLSPHTCQDGYYKKRKEMTNVGKDVEKRTPLYTVVGIQIGRTIMKNNMEIPQKLKLELPYGNKLFTEV